MGVLVPPMISNILSASSSRNASLALIPLLVVLYRAFRKPARPSKVSKLGERVLILGASSGVGRTMARQYAARGARVCVVGRRKPLLDEVVRECKDSQISVRHENILAVAADFTNVDDMVKVRATLEAEWGGLDTLVVAAGVSALQPLMAIAGVEAERGTKLHDATNEGIQRTATVAAAAVQGNYVGPLIAAVTFIPMLSNTSKAPSIVLLNSLASVIPAPTRTLYASTKAASLVLYQALSIEHPSIAFTFFMPSTIEGDFRASAVDSGPVRELDPNKHGLKREAVAQRCIAAADNGEGAVFMPVVMRYGHLLYWIWPALIERLAKRKYNFTT
ncbi:hypothetical protein GALMADRAFT_255450 [Galerina marginata CBS 339.88]|uniref:NAD(P)-binding protein n=1 Tax=Galerina marginata (strain CBS 339.88) TaxID=685588 RepID=A0A067SQW6_GALM3|nr:hypothetical protein GALMADRAFT_255450 [Galerina marginata CBS 339.88]